MNIIVSIFVKNNIYAVTILKDGKLYKKEVKRIKDAKLNESHYTQLLYALEKALRIIRNYVENNNDCDSFVFEMNNSTLIGWFNKHYSKPQYSEQFDKVNELLEEIPMKYSFVYNIQPFAKNFAKESNLTKLEISTFDFI